MPSESLRTATPADNDTSPRRSPSHAILQLLPSGQGVSEILQQMCGEISQTTTAEIVEVANSAVSRSKLHELMPVYFHSWELQSPEAVIIYLLLNYFVLWRDGSEVRRERQAFEEYIERLKCRVAELEKMREPDPDIIMLKKQVHDLKLENERLQRALNELRHSTLQPFDVLFKSLSFSSHFAPVAPQNKVIEKEFVTSTDEDTDTPAPPSYPHLVENCCAPSVLVQGGLEYECPSLSACPFHQDVSPHTYNWHCVVSGKPN